MTVTVEQLLGSWSLASLDHRLERTEWASAGEWSGRLLYAPGSRMAIVMRLSRAGDDPTELRPDELVSYAGTFSLEGDTVRHSIEVSARRSWAGTVQKRTVSLRDDILELLTPPFTTSRGAMQSRLLWCRSAEVGR